MAYYNRKRQFINTLESIAQSSIKDIELILVDDASYPEERVDDLVDKYPFMRIVRVDRKDKWYVCNCMPTNRGIAEAKGDIIVLQNPECAHVGDVLKYIQENVTDDNFLSISTYAFNHNWLGRCKDIIKNPYVFPQQRFTRDIGWYNHPVYRPVYFHFCAALTRKNMTLLGGFDERYAMGIARDDVEFIDRVDRLGLKKDIPTKVCVVHQWHSKVEHFHEGNYRNRIDRNRAIYTILTCNETSIWKENRYVKGKEE
jgi:GT2 family glycosyltransferase